MSKRKKKGKSKSKGLHGSGAAKGATGAAKGTGKELSKPLFIVAGLLAGNLIGKGIDKIIPVPADTPGFQIKKLVKPLAQAGVGVGVILLARSKGQEKQATQTVKELARSFGYGVAATGVISGVKLMRLKIFEGFGDDGSGMEGAPVEAKYYREAKDEIMKMLQDNSFRPALPEGNVSGFGEMDENIEMLGLNLGEGAEEAEII